MINDHNPVKINFRQEGEKINKQTKCDCARLNRFGNALVIWIN